MTNIKLTTAVNKEVDELNLKSIFIPKGTEGTLIDIIIEDGEVRFLLEFDTTIEWYDVNEVEERF